MYISIRPDLRPKRQQENLKAYFLVWYNNNPRNLGILDVRIDLIREAKDVEEAINPVDGKFQGAGAHKVVGTAIWHLSLRATERRRWSISTSKTEHIEQLVPEDEARQKYLRDFTVHHSIPHPRVEIVTERAQASTCAALTLSTRAGVSPGARPVHWGLDEAKTRGGLVECVTEASRYRGKKSGVRSMRSWILARKGPEIEYAVDAQGDDVERPSIIFMRRMAA
ncbi:hypothetical protein E4U24_005141 [Claviceps purpurea]|nr:hypothetical protein E4U24_005141 [Claviceps purpurea]